MFPLLLSIYSLAYSHVTHVLSSVAAKIRPLDRDPTINSNDLGQYLDIRGGVVYGFKPSARLPSDFDLVISNKKFSSPIRKIADYAFSGNKSIKKVVVDDEVSEIGDGVFQDCSNLAEVFLSRSVKRIGANVFDRCPKLRSRSLTSYSRVLFDWWVKNHLYKSQTLSQLDHINLEVYTNSSECSFNNISSRAFANCHQLKSIRLADSIYRLGSEVFLQCDNLQKVYINEKVEEIGTQIFKDCPQLISDGVVNYSLVLFDWWINQHNYCDQKLGEMSVVNLANYRNSTNTPFKIIGQNAVKVTTNELQIIDLIIPEHVKRINGTEFFVNDKLRRLFILSADLIYDKKLVFRVNQHVNFYITNRFLSRRIAKSGVSAKRVHLLTNAGDFFTLNHEELIILTASGKKAKLLQIPASIVKIHYNAFNDNNAQVFDFTKVTNGKKLTIEGEPFAGLTKDYKVRDLTVLNKLIRAGACAKNIENVDLVNQLKPEVIVIILSTLLPLGFLTSIGLISIISNFSKSAKHQ